MVVRLEGNLERPNIPTKSVKDPRKVVKVVEIFPSLRFEVRYVGFRHSCSQLPIVIPIKDLLT